MKKHFLLFLMSIVASQASFAQNTFTNTGTNVGIGTMSPDASLHVKGTFLTGGGEANIDPSPGNALGQLNFLSNSSSMLIGWNRTAGSGETDFISNQGPGGSGGFAFYNHDNSNLETQLMWIRGDGNVSIGTPDPHGYKLAVNGNIRAREIKVEAGPWPDYVFRPDYHLPSLNHVKTYIDHNGHLPDMPSALEVDKQGVNLGEMNRLLVKKVEELTLYLIEKDKNDKQKDFLLKHLQHQINQLKRSKQTHYNLKYEKTIPNFITIFRASKFSKGASLGSE